MIIADANIWIDFFKRRNARSSQALDALVREEHVALIGIVLTELLRGARSESQRRLMSHVLDGLPYLEMNRSNWAHAGRISMEMDAMGQRIPVTDALIAAISIGGDHEVFTGDKRHFESIPGLKLYEP